MVFRINDIFSNYLRHQDINDYLDYLELEYPTYVKVITAGCSYEGRPLKYIRISSVAEENITTTTINHSSTTSAATATVNNSKIKLNKCKKSTKRQSQNSKENNKNLNNKQSEVKTPENKIPAKQPAATNNKVNEKSVILIDGGLHAREWISIATAIYCIHQLTENLKKNQNLLRKLDFVIMPVVNADGYEYTHTNYRYWRKTRKPIDGCRFIGTDCNRNFDFHWNAACSKASKYTYRGVRPFSEPETEILKTIMHSLRPNCKFYLSLHSYAKAFMYPWGYTKELPDNWKALHKLAKVGYNAIKEKTGAKYRCGSVALLTKHTSAGGSPDYALSIGKIPYAMAMELSGGGYGFDPPPTEIRKLVQESWIGIQAMCNYIANI